ncbi:MAG: lysophospholipid acyltransferase family protein, partial [candidate division Zixibacteria bacterium]|nr:lysophospholipid acyltransferase family protein [candidate division Zixibacteria bacterium]
DCGLIRPGKNIRDIYRAFDANKFVVILPDQHDSTQSLIMDFLGEPASIFKGPAVFSLRTGVPIIPVMIRRERYDKHVIICDEIIYPPEDGFNKENIEMIMGKINKFIEGNIKKYPDQWLWTHRRWKVNKKKD